jgi:sodium-dependent phosphate cotransporter
MMGEGFKGFKSISEGLLQNVSHPIMGLVVGILATSILQSSSTTTSIVVGLVASNILGPHSIRIAIPILMGANIGTTITNTIVSLAHISRSEEFQRAFRAAVVHDLFNIITVIILLPLEVCFHTIEKTARVFTSFLVSANLKGAEFKSPIAAITKPIVHLLFNSKYPDASPGLLQKLFSPQFSKFVALAIALICLLIALKYMVKVMRLLVVNKIERFFSQTIFRNGFLALIFGLILTAIVQSSSITTSLVVPLAGAGILSIYQIFPYTVGANIGTTVTTLLAALATGSIPALVVALSHLCFNIFGMVIIMPVKPVRRIPIKVSGTLSKLVIKNRLYPILFILIVFFAIPILILLLTK